MDDEWTRYAFVLADIGRIVIGTLLIGYSIGGGDAPRYLVGGGGFLLIVSALSIVSLRHLLAKRGEG